LGAEKVKKCSGHIRRNDDEWYTPAGIAQTVANWLATTGGLTPQTAILCPADLLPDGSESEIPKALRAAGFERVRVTRDLPMDQLYCDYDRTANGGKGEVIVTNPPFTLLTPFRRWQIESGARYCILSRPGCIRGWTIPELGNSFYITPKKGVAAAWFQNLTDTTSAPDESKALGDCRLCERVGRCPANSHTRDWKPGRPRKLYGWCNAVKYGIAGNWCGYYTIGGKIAFKRFLQADNTTKEGMR
jgi:hypothetical protein